LAHAQNKDSSVHSLPIPIQVFFILFNLLFVCTSYSAAGMQTIILDVGKSLCEKLLKGIVRG